MRSAFNVNQCTKRARGGMRDEYAVSWFMHAGAKRGTEARVREGFARVQVQSLTNGRLSRDGNMRLGAFRGGAGTAFDDWETPRRR